MLIYNEPLLVNQPVYQPVNQGQEKEGATCSSGQPLLIKRQLAISPRVAA